MTQLTENIFTIEMPADAQPYILDSANGKEQGLFYKQPGNSSPPWIVLPPGNYSFICASLTATEEEAANIVTKEDHFAYWNYEGPFVDQVPSCRTALESLHSLLRSKGLNPELNYAILLKQF